MSKTLQRLDNLQQNRAEKNPAGNDSEVLKEQAFSKFGMVLWLLASISATVFSYHLGVRQGVQAAKNESPRQWLYYFNETAERNAAVEAELIKAQAPEVQAEIPSAPVPSVEAPKAKAFESGFTIQVVTYRSESLAKKEVERLSQKGHKAFVVPSGNYFQVCIDLFENKKLAMKKLVQLRTEKYYETYPGAFVKFLKPATNSSAGPP